MLTIGKLREMLAEDGELAGLSDETEVRLVYQPSYPLQCRLSEELVVVGCDDDRMGELREALDGCGLSDDEASAARDELAQLERDGNQTSTVYLAEGGQIYDEPYGPSAVTKQLGWR